MFDNSFIFILQFKFAEHTVSFIFKLFDLFSSIIISFKSSSNNNKLLSSISVNDFKIEKKLIFENWCFNGISGFPKNNFLNMDLYYLDVY